MFTDASLSATVDAAGNATITITPTTRQRWLVQQVVPEAENAASASGELRKNGRLVSPFLASGDVIADAPPVPVGPSDKLTVEWTGLTPGDTVHVYWIYDDGQPGPSPVTA